MDPRALVDLDETMLNTLAEARQERWGAVEELLATVVELLHAIYVVTVTVHSKKGYRPPPPLVVPRPGAKSKSVGPAELFRQMSRR